MSTPEHAEEFLLYYQHKEDKCNKISLYLQKINKYN